MARTQKLLYDETIWEGRRGGDAGGWSMTDLCPSSW